MGVKLIQKAIGKDAGVECGVATVNHVVVYRDLGVIRRQLSSKL